MASAVASTVASEALLLVLAASGSLVVGICNTMKCWQFFFRCITFILNETENAKDGSLNRFTYKFTYLLGCKPVSGFQAVHGILYSQEGTNLSIDEVQSCLSISDWTVVSVSYSSSDEIHSCLSISDWMISSTSSVIAMFDLAIDSIVRMIYYSESMLHGINGTNKHSMVRC